MYIPVQIWGFCNQPDLYLLGFYIHTKIEQSSKKLLYSVCLSWPYLINRMGENMRYERKGMNQKSEVFSHFCNSAVSYSSLQGIFKVLFCLVEDMTSVLWICDSLLLAFQNFFPVLLFLCFHPCRNLTFCTGITEILAKETRSPNGKNKVSPDTQK